MKKRDINSTIETIDKILGKLYDVNIIRVLLHNKNLLKNELEKIEEIKERPRIKEYETRRINICVKYCDKLPNGQPEIINGHFKGLDENDVWKKEMADLNTEYESDINSFNEMMIGFNDILNEQVDIEFKKIKFEEIDKCNQKENIITGKDIEVFQEFLED